jgi:hypothetical protein
MVGSCQVGGVFQTCCQCFITLTLSLSLSLTTASTFTVHSPLSAYDVLETMLEFRARPKRTARSPALRMSRIYTAQAVNSAGAAATTSTTSAAAAANATATANETVRLKVLIPTLAATKFRAFSASIPIQEAILQFNEYATRECMLLKSNTQCVYVYVCVYRALTPPISTEEVKVWRNDWQVLALLAGVLICIALCGSVVLRPIPDRPQSIASRSTKAALVLWVE